MDKKGSAAHIVANNCDTKMTLAPLCIEAARGGRDIDETSPLLSATEVYRSTRWNSAISSWLSVLSGIVADSDRRWAIKVDTLGSFAP